MIIRDGMNAKYTHDLEALIAWMGELLEFSGVPKETLIGWVRDGPMFSTDYWLDEQGDRFYPTAFFPYSVVERDRLIRVTLWKQQDTAKAVIDRHGFACLCCGQWKRFNERTGARDYRLWDILRDRQVINAPPLLCGGCGSDLLMILVYGQYLSSRRHRHQSNGVDGVVASIVARIRKHPYHDGMTS